MIYVTKGIGPSEENVDKAIANGDIDAGRMYENILIKQNRDLAKRYFSQLDSADILSLMEYGGCELTLIQFICSEFPEIAKEFIDIYGGLYVMHRYPYANAFAKHDVPGFKEYLMKLPPEELDKYKSKKYQEVAKYIKTNL